MKLDEWMKSKEMSDADLAPEIGVSSRAVGYYRTGERCPRRRVMEKIFAFTKGRVPAASFYE